MPVRGRMFIGRECSGVAEEDRILQVGRGGLPSFMRLLEARERVRELLATLLHVEAAQVTLTASTTDGNTSMLALGTRG